MPATPIFRAIGKNGNPVPLDSGRFAGYVRSLGELAELDLVVRKHRETRTLPQNSYLHKCIALWADDMGWEMEDLKDTLKARFLTYYPEGSPLPKIKRTRDLNTAEMVEFTEQIKRLAAEYDFRLPDPGQVDYA